MLKTDIAIIGGGLAGSCAAAMLGRAGISAVMVDPHPLYPHDFRCEKLDESQLLVLEKTGLKDHVLPAATLDTEVWVARQGRLLHRKRYRQYNILYDGLVNAVRTAIPPGVAVLVGKAAHLTQGAETSLVTLADGMEIQARLVVMANGLNHALRSAFGMSREEISPCHSISIGFDLEPVGPQRFPFPALTYFPEHPADRSAYCAFFPVGAAMRANYFVYREQNDGWLRQMRRSPVETLFETMPGLKRLTGDFRVTGPVTIRPVDLYRTQGHEQDGLVLIGDAFATSCPAAGTGTTKVFTDVERLCNAYIPRWLATPGMGKDKIAEFYADPVKRQTDAASEQRAYFLRSLSVETGPAWSLHRGARFVRQAGLGIRAAIERRLGERAEQAARRRRSSRSFGWRWAFAGVCIALATTILFEGLDLVAVHHPAAGALLALLGVSSALAALLRQADRF